MARLADRWSRRNVLAMSMAVWSGMTALCATASGFGQLALYRIGVGVGEAGGMPPSQSLLADVFPPEQRSFAQGVLAPVLISLCWWGFLAAPCSLKPTGGGMSFGFLVYRGSRWQY